MTEPPTTEQKLISDLEAMAMQLEGAGGWPRAGLTARAAITEIKRLDADAACEKAEKESLRLECERLRAQDEVHWKTRRSLLAERDALKVSLERVLHYWQERYGMNFEKTDEALIVEVRRVQKALHPADDSKKHKAWGTDPMMPWSNEVMPADETGRK